MRLHVGLLLISGMVVLLYLFGLLVGYQFPQVTPSHSPQTEKLVAAANVTHDQPPIKVDPVVLVPVQHPLDSSTPVFEEPQIAFEGNWTAIKASLRQNINCDSRVLRPRTYQRGSFWVLENYVAAERRRVHCYESVTYTTHTDYTFLDNLVPVVDRWRAPVSVAIYTPGDDMQSAKEAIYYMRNCLDNQRHMDLIKELVSFHLYFNATELPTGNIAWDINESNLSACDVNPMKKPTYKKKHKLFYPVNVGRNVARDAATTHFVLPSDIELYPSPNLVPRFLQMISKEDAESLTQRRVFPISIYEVVENEKAPNNKTELIKMIKQGKAIRFHARICPSCHSVPRYKEWQREPESKEMRIFTETKRTGYFNHWEPIYIGTRDDPYYDERLSWEGKSDKMTQGYILCLLDYTMSLLSDAFLTHRPGIKKVNEARRPELEKRSIQFIDEVIATEIHKIYGHRDECVL